MAQLDPNDTITAIDADFVTFPLPSMRILLTSIPEFATLGAMKYIKRTIDLEKDLRSKSVLLLGPRQTGKTQLIEHQVNPDVTYDLLQADTFRDLSYAPQLIRERVTPKTKLIAIDEIQKLPLLMDEVHSMIEKKGVRFLLTGSSARKLKRSHTSLMAGRARLRNLLPFTSHELGKQFQLKKALQFGLLPSIYLSDDSELDLNSYVGLYLKEEILSEALVRRIDNFSRFLQFSALTNGQILNFESVGSDAQISSRTIREYYAILEDTLIGNFLNPIRSTSKRKSTSTSKFYFFDTGIVNSLAARKIAPKSREYGEALEHFIFMELYAYKTYSSKGIELGFWNSPRQGEIDFVINEGIAIEVKASENISSQHLKGFEIFSKTERLERKILVCQEKIPRKIRDIEIIPVGEFLLQLWAGEFF
ncbi:MAG: ATP-binding protein [Bdellovibrionales bacterium]|nr:ATP-binding protein [Bdellovibrionales bacterium]